jgi:NitT/TauT family transport system substrate-binding protein
MKSARLSTRRTVVTALAAAGLPRLAAAQLAPRMIIGAVVAEDVLPVWYAQGAGLFLRAGLDVTIERVGRGATAVLGVVSGTYHVANTNLVPVITAHARGLPLTIVSSGGIYNGTTDFDGALVLKDSPLRTASDLAGRVFGISGVNDLFHLGMLSWMDRNGGDSRTLKIIEVPISAIVPALEERRIDIGGTVQPFLSTALASGKVRYFCSTNSGIAPRFAITGWVAESKWVEANPDAVRRFARVMRDARIYCNAHRTETAEIMVKNTTAQLQTILRGGRETFSEAIADVREVQPLIDVAAKYRAVDRRFDAGEIVSPVVRTL